MFKISSLVFEQYQLISGDSCVSPHSLSQLGHCWELCSHGSNAFGWLLILFTPGAEEASPAQFWGALLEDWMQAWCFAVASCCSAWRDLAQQFEEVAQILQKCFSCDCVYLKQTARSLLSAKEKKPSICGEGFSMSLQYQKGSSI